MAELGSPAAPTANDPEVHRQHHIDECRRLAGIFWAQQNDAKRENREKRIAELLHQLQGDRSGGLVELPQRPGEVFWHSPMRRSKTEVVGIIQELYTLGYDISTLQSKDKV